MRTDIAQALTTLGHQGLVTTGWLMLAAGSVIASLLAWARSAPGHLAAILRRRFVVEAEIRSTTQMYDFALDWAAAHPWLKRNRNWAVRVANGSAPASPGGPAGTTDEEHIELFPGVGNYLLWHEGRPVWMHRERTEPKAGEIERETMRLALLGGNRESLLSLLETIFQRAQSRREEYLTACKVEGTIWTYMNGIVRRPMESVILPQGMSEALLDDLREFLSSKALYRQWGIPWRRQILLEGPPGGGKTSLVQALAAELRRNLYCMNLASVWNDDLFFALLGSVSPGSILLIEDVDGCLATQNRAPQPADLTRTAQPESQGWQAARGVSLSALLNGLDGVFSQDGVITVLTTNYPERLDAAFLRPGRIDLRLHLGEPTDEQLSALWNRFFPDEPVQAAGFAAFQKPKSMAEAQHLLATLAKRQRKETAA